MEVIEESEIAGSPAHNLAVRFQGARISTLALIFALRQDVVMQDTRGLLCVKRSDRRDSILDLVNYTDMPSIKIVNLYKNSL